MSTTSAWGGQFFVLSVRCLGGQRQILLTWKRMVGLQPMSLAVCVNSPLTRSYRGRTKKYLPFVLLLPMQCVSFTRWVDSILDAHSSSYNRVPQNVVERYWSLFCSPNGSLSCALQQFTCVQWWSQWSRYSWHVLCWPILHFVLAVILILNRSLDGSSQVYLV